jgi:hypothetical protein
MNEEEKYYLFDYVKSKFIEIVNKTHYMKDNVNICCNDSETEFLMKYGDILSSKYPTISLRDIYIALIYTYYSLNLGEQTTDYLMLVKFKKYCDNYNEVNNLFLMLTTSNKSIATAVRRHFFGFPPLLKNGKSKTSSSIYRSSNARGVKSRRVKSSLSKKTRKYRKNKHKQ